MAEIELVIKIPEEIMEYIKNNGCLSVIYNDEIAKAIKNGTPLPKGHGRLIDASYLLNLIKCEEYESCTWKNCSDFNREKCIKKYDILEAPTIIEADKEE